MTKILFFIENLSDGGAERVLRNLVNNMDQSRFDITVQTIARQDPERYLEPGIRYKAINRCKTSIGKKLFSLWFRLCTELKWTYTLYVRGDYDVEVAYLECGPTKVIAGSTNKKAKKIAWVHCDLEKKGIVSAKTREQYKAFDKVVCVSEDTKRVFDKYFGDCAESEVLYNVVDEDEILRKASEPIAFAFESGVVNLLAVGRLVPVKGFDRLVKICAQLRDEGLPFCLHILGDGPERENLEQMIAAQHLENRVFLRGFTDNPYPAMKAADCIVCSSVSEGLSTVVLESLILGRPIVTTPCNGMKELLGKSEYGLIAEDEPDGLYLALRRMLSEPDLRRRYAEKAELRGRYFAKEETLKKIQAVLGRDGSGC